MITKINRKKLMDVLEHFQKVHAFANIVVLARESGCTHKGVSEVLQELQLHDRVQVIKIASYHPQTGELGEETCYRLGQPCKPKFSDIYMRMINKDIEKEKPRRRACRGRQTVSTKTGGGSGRRSSGSRPKSRRRPTG